MDVQLKRGLLEVCVLSVLKNSDSYGYQIIKDVSSCIEISESTLYPILKRLETSNHLSVYSVEHNGRLRKYYKITPLGEKKIIEFIEEWKSVMDVYNFIKGGQCSEQNRIS
ncbi:MAG: PadR family transcriptional regulator [Clostridiales bacterium GWF2_38_85]|nr:MAG: PadR family transcriptional regulator [Clostridiales bacterium GWF2_38_85]HBL83776.1 PadR family transcriptional regulator [Clostridiales bacterium]